MSLFLYHGPAGAGKASFLLESIKEKHLKNRQADFLILTPTPRLKKRVQLELLSLSNQPLKGPLVYTYDELIEKTLFQKGELRPLAPSSFLELTMANILHYRKLPWPSQRTLEVLTRLKSNHYTLNLPQIYQDLLSDLNKTLKLKDLQDPSDRLRLFLEEISKNGLGLPLQDLYLMDFFPLEPHHRELIHHLLRKSPSISLHLTYSFNFESRDDPFFYPTYSFLGELATQARHFSGHKKLSPIQFLRASSPLDEIDYARQRVNKLISVGIHPSRIGILIPENEFYREKIKGQFEGTFIGNVFSMKDKLFDEVIILGFASSIFWNTLQKQAEIMGEWAHSQNIALSEAAGFVPYIIERDKHLLNHLALTTQNITVTSPKYFWDGKPQQSLIELLSAVREIEEINLLYPEEKTTTKKSSFIPLQKEDFSLTELDTYRQCPFKYYAQHLLKLPTPGKGAFDISPSLVGTLVHQVLEELFKKEKLLFLEALEYELYLTRFKSRIEEIISKRIASETKLRGTPKAILDRFEKRLAIVLKKWADDEIILLRKNLKKTKPELFEWEFGKTAQTRLPIEAEGKNPIFLKGRVDRIDIDPTTKTFTVLDYKTGDLPSGPDLKEGRSFQVPFYMMAAQKLLFPDYTPSGGLLITFKDMSQKGLLIKDSPDETLLARTHHITGEEWALTQQKASLFAHELAEKISKALFEPNPLTPWLCQSCDYRALCPNPGGEPT